MGFWGPQTCPWLKIVTNFFFLGVQQNSKFEIWPLDHISCGHTSLAGGQRWLFMKAMTASCCPIRSAAPEIRFSISHRINSLILCSFVLYFLHTLFLQPGQNRSNLPVLNAEFWRRKKSWPTKPLYFGCSKETSHWDGSFEYSQHTWPYVLVEYN